ncbi:hypothetical protein I7I51_04328 [Histoplasma capsulatum]|uniref:Uncharacterized protein n=1 Tax=Ajellomyces capsulatus TaxID=5037 RepID=A0A8A1M848_AJECA|nr:predicted protein [Histoplasma mississippiense (nom. inval.)]EDN07759.1 predicted protein [Histoplasma mississippiense (nom. inval.)]QSS62151.1 hypothetical protein I7I51_04328 [Histoplasma capsulatum]
MMSSKIKDNLLAEMRRSFDLSHTKLSSAAQRAFALVNTPHHMVVLTKRHGQRDGAEQRSKPYSVADAQGGSGCGNITGKTSLEQHDSRTCETLEKKHSL